MNAQEKALRQFAAGAGAGVITKSTVAPLERMKVLFQVQGMSGGGTTAGLKYTSPIQAAATIFREEGVRGFYKGNGANCLRVIPVYALKFPLNDIFKEMVRKPGQEKKKLKMWQMMAAGSGAGLVQILLTYPLDLIRTRLQLSLSLDTGARYNGIGHCAVSIFRTEGLSALYKGLGPTLFMGIPYVGMQMTFYATFKNTYANYAGVSDPEKLPLPVMLACGSAAGLTSQTISFPADTVRHRMQANGINGSEKIYTNTLDCFKKMYQREGVRSFYKGWALNAVRCIPGAALQFAAYDTLKRLLLVN